MYCTKCGSLNAVGSAYCVECGNALKAAAPQPQPQKPQPQPQPQYQDANQPFDNNLKKAIWAAILFPLGIPAIIFSAKANHLMNLGQREAALEAVARSRKFTTLSFAIGIPFQAFFILMQIIIAIAC